MYDITAAIQQVIECEQNNFLAILSLNVITIWNSLENLFKALNLKCIHLNKGNMKSFLNIKDSLRNIKEIIDISKKTIIIVGNKCELFKEKVVNEETSTNYENKVNTLWYIDIIFKIVL